MDELKVAACLPVDTSGLPDLGMPLPKPTDLYSLIQCEACERDMWIGPRQIAHIAELRQRETLVIRLCLYCVVAVQSAVGEYEMYSLGGGEGVEGVVRG